MSILTPSTTPTTRQVWPRLPKPGEPEIVHVPREQRKPVTFDEVKVGDTLSVLVDEDYRYKGERVGKVIQINGGKVMLLATERGRIVLTRKNWDRKAPRR